MRVLFDNGTPRGVAAALADHIVEESRSRGWDTLTNGELLDAAEGAGFEVFVTTDRHIRYQQNLLIARLRSWCSARLDGSSSGAGFAKSPRRWQPPLREVMWKLRYRTTDRDAVSFESRPRRSNDRLVPAYFTSTRPPAGCRRSLRRSSRRTASGPGSPSPPFRVSIRAC